MCIHNCSLELVLHTFVLGLKESHIIVSATVFLFPKGEQSIQSYVKFVAAMHTGSCLLTM